MAAPIPHIELAPPGADGYPAISSPEAEVIQHPSLVEAIGDVGEFVVKRVSEFDDGNRTTRTGTIEVDGYNHLVRISEANPDLVDSYSPSPHRFIFGGLTEASDTGAAKALHDTYAIIHPNEVTVSIATDGVSVHGEALPASKALHNPFLKMAADRRRMIIKLAGREAPVSITGRSMGSVIALYAAYENLLAEERQSFNLESSHWLSPGIIAVDIPESESFRQSLDGKAAKLKLFGDFLRHVAVDCSREGINHPLQSAEAVTGILSMYSAYIKSPTKLAAVAGNLNQLKEGVPYHIIKLVASNTKVVVTAGDKDPVADPELMFRLQELYPNTFSFTQVKGGHLYSVATHSRAEEIFA